MHSISSDSNDSLVITLAEGDISHRTAFHAVIDCDGQGEVIGVEILDFRQQTGASIPQSAHGSLPDWNYDDESDAFYVRISDGNAPRQEKVKGTAALNADNLLLELMMHR